MKWNSLYLLKKYRRHKTGKLIGVLPLIKELCKPPEIKSLLITILLFTKCQLMGESNGKLPLRTFPGCSVPEPCRSPDWALVPAQNGPRAEY
jgi:hypothetical protein